MSELRLNPLTDEWVIMAPGRNARPQETEPPLQRGSVPQHVESCPFCPGNEAMGEEVFRLAGNDGTGWRTRVVRNKYPALAPSDAAPRHRRHGPYRAVDAYGAHEVVIESPRHDLGLAEAPSEHVAAVLRTYRARYRALLADPHIVHIVAFRNHGHRAGTSLAHPHSQIVGSPIVSRQVGIRLDRLAAYRTQRGSCLCCDLVARELDDSERVLVATPHFAAFIPYAALSPYHLWIFPVRHERHFGNLDDAALSDLASVLRTVLRMLFVGLGDPHYNLVIRSAPDDPSIDFHWYLAIVPRVSRVAGFELGSGMFINTQLPEDSAALLRRVEIRP